MKVIDLITIKRNVPSDNLSKEQNANGSFGIYKKSVVNQDNNAYNNHALNVNQKGDIGEYNVAQVLELLDKNEYKVINGLLIPFKNGNTVQIDHLIVARTGIFVIETKNISGIVKKQDDNFWFQVNGKYTNTFYSPIKQNSGHILAIKKILGINSERIFHSIAVFPNDTKVEISDDRIVTIDGLCAKIESFDEHVMNYSVINKMYDSFKKFNIDSEENRQKHTENLQKKIYR